MFSHFFIDNFLGYVEGEFDWIDKSIGKIVLVDFSGKCVYAQMSKSVCMSLFSVYSPVCQHSWLDNTKHFFSVEIWWQALDE